MVAQAERIGTLRKNGEENAAVDTSGLIKRQERK